MTLLLWLALTLAPLAAYALNGETVNVVTAGLVPDSPLNQSAAFRALLAAHGNDTIYFFPAGTYIVSGMSLTGAKQLTFTGEGAASIWQYYNPAVSYNFMFTCTACEDITFRNFTVDNRHILRYGGLRFYASTRMLFDRMVFTDSMPRVSFSTDVYGVVFGSNRTMSDTITVQDSLFYKLSLEIDHARNVTVQRNTFYDTSSTATIGAFSRHDGGTAQNWLVQDNHILHPARCAICFNLDPPLTNNTQWRHLRVLNNTIERISNGRYNIRFGTGNTSVRVTGTIFDDILTQGNTVRYIGVPQDQPLVKLSGSPAYGITFTNTHLED